MYNIIYLCLALSHFYWTHSCIPSSFLLLFTSLVSVMHIASLSSRISVKKMSLLYNPRKLMMKYES